jgi:hypothetical protein
MKTNTIPTSDLQSALDKCEAIEASLVKEAKLLADSAAELNTLQRTIDISDIAQVQRMTPLLTIERVGGPRRSYRHQENETAKKALVAHCATFAKEHLAPRLRQLETRARAKVEQKLKQHFADKESLQSATNHSTELAALAPIQAQVIIHDYSTDGAIHQAKVLLEAWAAADSFEAKHLG